jgi:hypothetical protein
MENNTIKCKLCGLICSMQISGSHLRAKHNMTTKEYRALGYKTLSPARLKQLRQSPVGSGKETGIRRLYGPDHPNWKGGHVNGQGYRIVYHNGKRRVEHRVIAEEILGRSLTSDEVVHHKDGNRANNSPNNLEVMTRRRHTKTNNGIRAYFYTGPECEEAVRVLHSLGWSKGKITRALRITYHTTSRWLAKSDKSNP